MTSCCFLLRALQHVGAQRLTDGRGGASRRLRRPVTLRATMGRRNGPRGAPDPENYEEAPPDLVNYEAFGAGAPQNPVNYEGLGTKAPQTV